MSQNLYTNVTKIGTLHILEKKLIADKIQNTKHKRNCKYYQISSGTKIFLIYTISLAYTGSSHR